MDRYRTLILLAGLWLLAFGAQAEPRVVLGDGDIELTDFAIGYFVDQSQALSYPQVRNQTFTETGNRTTLGTNARVTWYRVILDNPGPQPRTVSVHLPHAYHVQEVALYEEQGGRLVRDEHLALDEAADSPLMYRGVVVYSLTVPAGASTTLYVRSHSYSHQWFALEILDQDHSRRALMGSKHDIALMVGMMLALVFYNCLLYFATSKKENIYYSLYLISGLVWIALSYGLVASLFNAYGSTVFQLNMSLITMPIFLLLFMMSIFDTRRLYPTEHRCLQALLVLLVATLAYSVFDISGALKPASSLAALMMVVTFSVSISLYRKGNPLVKFFLVGHTFFVVFNGIAVLFYKGLIAPSYWSSHGVGIGIVLEALTLAFIISYRIKVLEDIRASQDELKKQAATDPLTRLYNRRYFHSEADFLLELAKSRAEPLSVLVLDIDHFKQVNDSHGHHVGDQVIVRLAQVLRQFSRSNDLVARFGGEEFVMLLPNADRAEAEICSERIRAATESLAVAVDAGTSLRFTISIGIAEVAVGQESIESAIKRADRALYRAKRSGRNRVCVDLPAPA